jgi:hypothetical protein
VSRPIVRHLALLTVYLAAGVAVTWPRATYITGLLPESRDVSSYVWDLWWIAHQVIHLGNPYFTTQMAAPTGIQLGFDTTMPLAGLIMTPVTVAFGPSVSFTLLTILAPGLACYFMYRAARLWLAGPGAIAAGALFGLSAMLAWQDWYHLNIALGTLFLPMTLEAAVRLRRRPRRRQAAILGLILGASVLVNQESAVLAVVLAAVILLPWLLGVGAPSAAAPGSALPAPASAGPASAPTAPPDSARVAAPDSTPAAPDSASAAALDSAPAAALDSAPAAVTRDSAPAGSPAAAYPARARLAVVALGALVAAVIASPQLIAMVQQYLAGGANADPRLLAMDGAGYGVGFPGIFAPTARVAHFGLQGLAAASAPHNGRTGEGMPMFGLLLTVLAVLGLAAAWRRRPAWLFALLWLGCAVLALGPALYIGNRGYLPFTAHLHGVPVSWLMPYTWIMNIPGLSALREADRFALLGLVGAAVLAGAAVDWLARHAWPLIIVVALLAVLEAGWQGGPPIGVMPTTLHHVDGPIAADHSGSIVVDVPYGLRGGIPQDGSQFSAKALLMATADGHPRAVSYTSWVPSQTIDAIADHVFYAQLIRSEHGIPLAPAANSSGQQVSQAQLAAARRDVRAMHVGWALVYTAARHPNAIRYLLATGFRFDYQADGIAVYRLTGH